MNKKAIKIMKLLMSKSVFEESENGDKEHVIWSNEFWNLSQAILEIFNPQKDGKSSN